MPKSNVKWLLYEYSDAEFRPLSKTFETREEAEKAREKYPQRKRGSIGVGVVRLP